MRTTRACLLAAALALPAGGHAQPRPIDHSLPAPAGTTRLTLPAQDGAPIPLVILLPDALGDQGRSDPYVEALAARGIASLVVGLDAAGPGGDVARTKLAAAVARNWAAGHLPAVNPDLVGLVGFGTGARAALAAADGAPVVALDPGCEGLALPSYSPVLLVHGGAASDAAACSALPEPAGTAMLALPGASHAWDLPPALAPGGALVPSPSGEGRQRARPDLAATALAAQATASWLFQQLTPPRDAGRSAAR
ncbi:hypothetical protein [Falsiroseomonas ponticola]|uniref:hypothetical protein n=1 Tax=Falsiroseomonas ponticola TaxID=2786951 RepID=UPI0019321C25|nr:hypothetical protein [Roseomonas ponticola]